GWGRAGRQAHPRPPRPRRHSRHPPAPVPQPPNQQGRQQRGAKRKADIAGETAEPDHRREEDNPLHRRKPGQRAAPEQGRRPRGWFGIGLRRGRGFGHGGYYLGAAAPQLHPCPYIRDAENARPSSLSFPRKRGRPALMSSSHCEPWLWVLAFQASLVCPTWLLASLAMRARRFGRDDIISSADERNF